MDLFNKAMEQFKNELVDELEKRLWVRLEERIRRNRHGTTLSIYEAAEYMHMSDRTLRRMVQQKEIPHFRLRNRIYIRQMDIDDWIQRQLNEHEGSFDHRK